MERYLLLRSNRESGPYTVKELREKGLFTTDLLWLEGESTSWKHPKEFADLTELAKEPTSTPALVKKLHPVTVEATGRPALAAEPATAPFPTKNVSGSFQEEVWQGTSNYDPFLEEQEETRWQTRRRKKAWHQGISIGANLFGLATLVIAVMLSAVMVKKAVDNMAAEPEEPTADAREIVSESLQESSNQHAALSTPVRSQPAVKEATPDSTIAMTIQVLPKPTAALAKKETPKEAPKKKQFTTPLPVTQNTAVDETTQGNELEENLPAAEPEKPAPKPALQIAANDYKVGLFGGISNLALTVNNPSSVTVEHLTLEVEYLKPNGKVVGTKMVEVGSVAPGTSKTVTVPDNGRGVSIRYRVVE